MNSATERSSYLLLSLPSKVWWLTTNHIGYIISIVLSTNMPKRFITAYVVATKNEGSSAYLINTCTELMCTTTRMWASYPPAARSLSSTIWYSSGGSYSLAFVTRNEFVHDILLTAIKNKNYWHKIHTSKHDNTRRKNCKYYITINYGNMRRDWVAYWVGLGNIWYCRDDIGWVWYHICTTQQSEFCCKSMGAFWTHNNKHWREVLIALYAVLILIQEALIFAWVRGEHISCHFYHTYQQNEYARRYK